ncbi:24923_t:CDS:2, partial [Cetraspora pellucida]
DFDENDRDINDKVLANSAAKGGCDNWVSHITSFSTTSICGISSFIISTSCVISCEI